MLSYISNTTKLWGFQTNKVSCKFANPQTGIFRVMACTMMPSILKYMQYHMQLQKRVLQLALLIYVST